MPVFAIPGNKLPVVKLEDSKAFIEEFNNSKPSEEFLESRRKAGRLLGTRNDRLTVSEITEESKR